MLPSGSRVADRAHRLPQGRSHPNPLHHHAHRARRRVSGRTLGCNGYDHHERGDGKVRGCRRIQGAESRWGHRAPDGTPGGAPMPRATRSPPPPSRPMSRQSCTTRRARPARRRACCMALGPCTRGGCRPGTGSRCCAEDTMWCTADTGWSKAGDEHLLRGRGAVARRCSSTKGPSTRAAASSSSSTTGSACSAPPPPNFAGSCSKTLRTLTCPHSDSRYPRASPSIRKSSRRGDV